jgi:hypothetical protein
MGKIGQRYTRLFNTKATINYRDNYIGLLTNEEQAKIIDHDGKATVLWKAFREGMGTADKPNMLFNPVEIYGNNLDPTKKSPGPDVFKTEFIKCCWSIISIDIKALI